MYGNNVKTMRKLNTYFNEDKNDILFDSFKMVMFEALKSIMNYDEECADNESIQKESCVNSV